MATDQGIDSSSRIKYIKKCIDKLYAATRHSWQPYKYRDFLSYLTLYGGGPSLSINGLAPLYCPGVGVRGRARFAYISNGFYANKLHIITVDGQHANSRTAQGTHFCMH